MQVAAAIKKLDKAAAAFGGHVEDDSSGHHVNLQVCAPEGKEWVATDGPHIVVATAKGPQEWLDGVVAGGLEDIALGVRDSLEEQD